MFRTWFKVAGAMLLSTSALAAPTPNYEADATSVEAAGYSRLRSAVIAGNDIVVVARFNQCAMAGQEGRGPDATGVSHIDTFLMPNRASIVFSVVHETLNLANEKITEFIRYKVQRDGKVIIRTASLQAGGGAISNDARYECELGKGVQFSWVARRGAGGIP